MSEYDRRILGKQAAELGFIRDAFEKVYRLSEVLNFFERDPILANYLALKGGTAINLTIFNLPRLSVDIDLDFAENLPLDAMKDMRSTINDIIFRFMQSQGYERSIVKSKQYHTLDSFVYMYTNAGGVRDNIKVEVNYSLRSHVLPLNRRQIETLNVFHPSSVLSLNPIEIFASKTVAFLTRAAARDLYDLSNMAYYGLFDKTEMDMLRNCVVFYSAVASESVPETFDFDRMDAITNHKIKTDLLPVIRKKDKFDLAAAKELVREYLSPLLVLTEKEKEFLSEFRRKSYHPELLFEGEALERVRNHPMAIWKMQQHERIHGDDRIL